jgi:hypothetical protein
VGWVRTNRRYGGWLALLALAIQLAVSFGHFHLGGPVSAQPGLTAAAPAGDHGSAPASDHDPYCDICATIHALSSAQIAAPPQLPVPIVFGRTKLPVHQRIAAAETCRTAFQSRAPPLA